MDVTLRPVTADDVDLLERFAAVPADTPYDDFGFRWRRVRERWEADGLLGPDGGRLLIEADGVESEGEVVGDVSWMSVVTGPLPGSSCWNIGIWVRPAARGRGVGSRAQRLLADYLFAHTLAHRVEATTDVTNTAEQRALERAGFTREGVLRGEQWRLGAWHDMAVYSRLRTDP